MLFPLDCATIADLLGSPHDAVAANWPAIENSMNALGMLSAATKIAALATIRVECPPFHPIREYGGDTLHEQMYGHRADLGNSADGDGARYAGRGYIQLTGKSNYQSYGAKLGVDLVADPDAALEPNTAAMIFAAYFFASKAYQYADIGDWMMVRKRVNGGLNGMDKFRKYVDVLLMAVDAASSITERET